MVVQVKYAKDWVVNATFRYFDEKIYIFSELDFGRFGGI